MLSTLVRSQRLRLLREQPIMTLAHLFMFITAAFTLQNAGSLLQVGRQTPSSFCAPRPRVSPPSCSSPTSAWSEVPCGNGGSKRST